MRRFLLPLLAVALLLSGALQLQASPPNGTVLFSDNFESYNTGYLAGQAGAPWINDFAAGSGTHNQQVNTSYQNISATNGNTAVTPQLPGSTKYLTGASYNDYDNDMLNLAYHVGGGAKLTGNFKVDWAFYDPIGLGVYPSPPANQNAANYTDAFCLSNIIGLSNTSDPTAYFSGAWGANANRIEVGATPIYSGTWDRTKYQVRCFGYTDGYNGGNWFNTTVSRSIGWHTGEISVSAPLANGTNMISIYIDGTLVFNRNSTNTGGFNALEVINGSPGYSGAYDNVVITEIPEPGTLLALGTGLLGLLGFIKKRK